MQSKTKSTKEEKRDCELLTASTTICEIKQKQGGSEAGDPPTNSVSWF